MRLTPLLVALAAVLALASAACSFTKDQYFVVNNKTHPVRTSPLLDYVFTPDDAFSYYDTGKEYKGVGWTGYLLNVTSQRWMEDVSTHPVWWHNVLVIRPHHLNNDTNIGALYVTGDNNEEGRTPKELSADVIVASTLAVESNSVVAILYNIPNQKMAFKKPDGTFTDNLSEDGLVAYTWAQYVNAPARAEQVVYLPMVKSVFATMDAVTNYTSNAKFQRDGT